MEPFVEDYLDRLADIHGELNEAIDGLPPEALDWSPGPEMNSITVVATHVAGAERYWIGELAGGISAERDRPAEFRSQGATAESLLALLDEALARSKRVCAALTPEDLVATRQTGFKEYRISVAWGLLHALDHASTHLGHIQLTRQLWEHRSG